MKFPLRAVIFDLDDTLFDDATCTHAGLAELARLHGITHWTPQAMFTRHAEIIDDISPRLFSGQITGHTARVLRYSRLLAEWGVPDPDGEAATHAYRAAYVGAWTLIDGAAEILHDLRGRGFKIGILTNYVQEVQLEKLRVLRLLDAVDAILCIEDLPAPKPDARAYRTACALLDVAPAEAVMIGDSWTNDVEGAMKAGLRAIWFDRQSRKAPGDGVPQIQRLNELSRLI